MKKLFTVLAAALMISVSASAQHEIGGIVGGMYGASYKYWFNDNVALQADLAVGLTEGSGAYYTRVNGTSYHSANFHTGMYDFTINPNALYHFELPANFKLYVGGGVGFGLVNFLESRLVQTCMIFCHRCQNTMIGSRSFRQNDNAGFYCRRIEYIAREINDAVHVGRLQNMCTDFLETVETKPSVRNNQRNGSVRFCDF